MNTNQLELKLLSIVKDFDYLACAGTGLLPTAIKTVTRGKYSHSAHFRIIQGKLFVVDAQKDGYNPKPFIEWHNQFKYSFVVLSPIIPFTEIEIKEMNLIEYSLIGKEYDFKSLLLKHPRKEILKGLEYITGKEFDVWKEETIEESMKRLYCSEAEALIYSRPNAQVNPTELYNDLVSNGFKEVFTHKK
jgi:hypothetical protein